MYNHAPKDYICPFCLLVQGIENKYNAIQQTDIVYHNDIVTSFIGLRKWPNNAGHVLTIPNEHYENIYGVPENLLAEMAAVVKRVCVAVKKTVDADGIKVIQLNGRAAGQVVMHLHIHVIPTVSKETVVMGHRGRLTPERNELDKTARKIRENL